MSVDGIGDGPKRPQIEASPENVKEDGEIIAAKGADKANAEIIAAKEEDKVTVGNEKKHDEKNNEKNNGNVGNEKKKEDEKNRGDVGNEKKEDEKNNGNEKKKEDEKNHGNDKKKDEKNNVDVRNEKKDDEKNNENVGNEKKDHGNEKKKENEKNNENVGNEKKEDEKNNGSAGIEKEEDEKNNGDVRNEKNNENVGNKKKEDEKDHGNEKKKENEKNNENVGNEKDHGNEKKKEDEKNNGSAGIEKEEDEKNNGSAVNEKNHGNEKKEEDEKNNGNIGNEKNNENVGNKKKEDEKNNQNAGNEKNNQNVGNEKEEDEKNNQNAGNEKEIKKGECSSSPSLDGKKKEENTKEVEQGESCRLPSEAKEGESSSSPSSSSIAEVKDFPYDLSEHERKGLVELRSKLEHVISTDALFKKDKKPEPHTESPTQDEAEDTTDKGEAKVDEEKPSEGAKIENIDKDIALFGVPLLPSKGEKATDVLLLKFLKARDFKANDAFEMLRNTLEWRKENNIDSIMEEDFGNEYDCVGYMHGLDLEGHPICYNFYGAFADEEVYNKTFGTEESRERFLRWRLQLMEKQIRKLDFSPGGIASLVQINDLDNAPLPSRKDLRLATKRALGIFQDNYPEVISRNIFINVPLWYYAFSALISPFLTQATKSKFVFCRPSKVTETLLRYISVEELPALYGGLGRENDPDFSSQDSVSEVNIKAGETETIEIPASEVGKTLIWDLTIIGWDVNYKEEFVPTNEGSYTVIVKKVMKISSQDQSIRNSFKINNEPGNIVITIENGSSRKKRMLYRYKTKCT